jgi:two-component system sensor histidine kinase KdpD
VVNHQHAGLMPTLPRGRGSLSRRRRRQGFALAVVLLPLLTAVLVPAGPELNLVSDMLLFLLATVVVAIVGGLAPAMVAAVLGSLLLNYFFTPPLHTLTIRDTNNTLALLVFIVVGILVSSVVDMAARRTREASRAAAEARTLANLAGSVLGGEEALTSMLERVRETFALASATVLQKADGEWTVLAHAGPACAAPGEAETDVPAGRDLVLALKGRLLEAEDQRLVGAFAAQVGVVVDRIRLAAAAAEAAPLVAANQKRTALLAAVGHDLRTPLAAAKAAVSSLLVGSEGMLSPQDRHELLIAADESLDRLAKLVDNLLDMSRLQAGALTVSVQPTSVDELVARSLDDLGDDALHVRADVPEDLPPVLSDPGLLERVIVNLLANALRYSPADAPPHVTASRLENRVEVRVVDRGPGIPTSEWEAVFRPFQRLGDTDNTTGVGLGLALARGLTEAMGGTLEPEETPGGGLTMVVALPVGDDQTMGAPGLRERQAAAVPGGRS